MLVEKFRKLKKYDPEAERKLRQDIEEAGGLEKNDVKAMIIAAFLIIMPIALIILSLFGLMAFMFF